MTALLSHHVIEFARRKGNSVKVFDERTALLADDHFSVAPRCADETPDRISVPHDPTYFKKRFLALLVHHQVKKWKFLKGPFRQGG